jgi:hypothetical protein
LRPSIGLSGLQGPGRLREKLEKERSELRDLVIPETATRRNNVLQILIRVTVLCFLFFLIGGEKPPRSQSDRGCGPSNVQRYCSSQSLRAGLLV